MKRFLLSIWTAIKNGILRIFPLPLKPFLYVTAILTVLTVYSCSTPRHTTQQVRDIQRDTVYMNSQQYDSIYIYKEHTSDFKPSSRALSSPIQGSQRGLEDRGGSDTVYIKDVSVEYRYKLLRDTVKVIQRDSIPYEVTITEVKEITRPLTAFDHICRFCFIFILSVLFVGLVRLMVKLKKNLRKFAGHLR